LLPASASADKQYTIDAPKRGTPQTPVGAGACLASKERAGFAGSWIRDPRR